MPRWCREETKRRMWMVGGSGALMGLSPLARER